MPIIDAIKKYTKQYPVRFHVPGHKGRTNNPFFSAIFPNDLTEIPGLDDLHQAEEAILLAQQLAAQVFHAEETFFLVGGSTVGNLAMLLATTQAGDSVVVQRNAHKSVMNGITLAHAKPIYLSPEFDQQTGLALTVSIQKFERILQEKKPRAAFLTNPNYFGMTVDLEPYANLCKQYRIPLLVDEAHGAHFGHHESLPPTAMQAGASASVQSTHKMLPSLTMSSMLHIQGDLIDRARLRRSLAMVQSSSPSYPLLASLDYARHYLHHQGGQDLARVIQWVQQFYRKIEVESFPWLQFVTASPSYDFLDPLKITLRTRSAHFHGFALKEYLERHGIYAELADEQFVLLALSPFTEEQDLHRLLDALRGIEVEGMDGLDSSSNEERFPSYTFAQEVVLLPSETHRFDTERISITDAVGRVSAERVTPYPPGVPVINPGERLDAMTLTYIVELKRMGCRFHDLSDLSLETILVIKDYL
ncbi:hypothetical protein BEP19_11270 [Ammoniphilus oxalaticus]|uniref:Lysine decarboxylase n=2 Tax=Ammoniphilus oxalaticus TaxID=66863 RepID=A0A419SHG4_9BACL|nr:hypothetical protein BEP19_11270 [Ammoniphilus oxalaticus]